MNTDGRTLHGFSPKERLEYETTSLRLIFAAHVENYLGHAGLQAKDLASRIGKSRAWVSKLLSGRQNATLDTLAEVALALGAQWQVSLVAANRNGTPAQNDPVPPGWALRGRYGQVNQPPIFVGEGLAPSLALWRSVFIVSLNEAPSAALFSMRAMHYWSDSFSGQGSEIKPSEPKILLGSRNMEAVAQ